jgi:hypothetical protein
VSENKNTTQPTATPPVSRNFDRAELTLLLNNVLQVSAVPPGWPAGGIPDRRKEGLRKVALAQLEVFQELMKEDFIRAEEVVYTLLALALQVQIQYVNAGKISERAVVSAPNLAAIKKLLRA